MPNVHHATRKAAERDLERGIITEQINAPVIAGQMDLSAPRNTGADGAPDDTSRATEVQDDAGTVAPSARAGGVQGSADVPPQLQEYGAEKGLI